VCSYTFYGLLLTDDRYENHDTAKIQHSNSVLQRLNTHTDASPAEYFPFLQQNVATLRHQLQPNAHNNSPLQQLLPLNFLSTFATHMLLLQLSPS
jgi:hypothetical protein